MFGGPFDFRHMSPKDQWIFAQELVESHKIDDLTFDDNDDDELDDNLGLVDDLNSDDDI